MTIALPATQQTTKLIRMARCENCKFAERESNPSPVFSCHKNPPCATILPTKAGPMPFTSFPLVEPEHWCDAHVTKLNGTSE